MRLNQISIACTDYAASVAFYRALGLRQIVDAPPSYARFECLSRSAEDEPPTLSLHTVEPGTQISTTMIYFEVEEVDATCKQLHDEAAIAFSAPQDQHWLWREAWAEDPAGNRVCIYHAGTNRRFPPWRVEG